MQLECNFYEKIGQEEITAQQLSLCYKFGQNQGSENEKMKKFHELGDQSKLFVTSFLKLDISKYAFISYLISKITRII